MLYLALLILAAYLTALSYREGKLERIDRPAQENPYSLHSLNHN